VDGSGAPLEEAFAPMSVALRLADEIDISRGDMIVHASDVPRVEQRFDAMMVWLQERPLDRARSYFLKHTTRMVRAAVEAIAYRLNLDTLENVPASELVMNDIARVTVHAQRPLFVDAYARNRVTGAFILVDALTNDTVAAGMILEAREEDGEGARSEELSSLVSQSERRDRVGHTGAAIVIEAGGRGEETSAAYALERILFDRGYLTAVVTGEGAESAAVACVGAGVLAVCVTSRLVGAGLRERLGSERVVFVGAGSAEEMAAEAGRRLAERGVSLPHSL
jgi:hypothetical protein